MNGRKIILGFYLLISPTIVTVAQLSVLSFPSIDPLMGIPASPYPEVFFPPIRYGLLLLIIGYTIDFLFNKKEGPKYIKAAWIGSSLLFSVVFWLSITSSQRAVIMKYLNATNANGFHFLGRIFPPMLPEVFPKTAYLPYYTVLIIGILGVLLIIINSIFTDRGNLKL